MFEILYKDPATIERYRLAPLLEDRERYLCAVVASGVVGDVARRVARAQLALMDLLNLPDADIPVGLATVETAVQGWCRNVPAVSAADFRRHAFRWLRFLGWLEEPVRDAHPHARQVEAFAAWMRDDRGLSEATISNCCYESDRLFAWAAGRCLDPGVGGGEIFQVVEVVGETVQAGPRLAVIAVPQVSLDASQFPFGYSRLLLVMVGQPLSVLPQHGEAHIDMEPVEHVLGVSADELSVDLAVLDVEDGYARGLYCNVRDGTTLGVHDLDPEHGIRAKATRTKLTFKIGDTRFSFKRTKNADILRGTRRGGGRTQKHEVVRTDDPTCASRVSPW